MMLDFLDELILVVVQIPNEQIFKKVSSNFDCLEY